MLRSKMIWNVFDIIKIDPFACFCERPRVGKWESERTNENESEKRRFVFGEKEKKIK